MDVKRAVRLLTLGAICLAVALAGCEQKGAGPAPPAPAPKAPAGTAPAAPAAPAEPIKIGAIFAETGPAAFLGAPEVKTLKMVVEELNAAGGLLGRQVVADIRDSQGNPELCKSLAQQLIEEQKVLAIIGPTTSGETMAIKDMCEKAKTLLLSCAAAEAIVNPLASHVFKSPQKDSDVVKLIYQTMGEMGISRIGVVASNTGFGQQGKLQLEKYAPDYKIEIAIAEVYDKNATDLTGVVTKVKGANVQAIVNWSIEPAQATVIKNVRDIKFDVPIFQSHGFGNIQYAKAAGAAAEGVIFPAGRLLVADTLPAGNKQKALLTKYKKDYEARYKEEASTFGGHGYDAFLVLSKAIEKAGGPDKDKVRAAIEGLQGLVGTAGIFNFSATDHNGLGMDAFEMLTVKGGKFVLYTEPVAKK
jgi:branched-chain amino acid transport system substrate-binding protein